MNYKLKHVLVNTPVRLGSVRLDRAKSKASTTTICTFLFCFVQTRINIKRMPLLEING